MQGTASITPLALAATGDAFTRRETGSLWTSSVVARVSGLLRLATRRLNGLLWNN